MSTAIEPTCRRPWLVARTARIITQLMLQLAADATAAMYFDSEAWNEAGVMGKITVNCKSVSKEMGVVPFDET